MAFELFIMFVIVVNMIPIIMAFKIQETDDLYPKVEPFFFYSNFIFTGLFVLEAIIKVQLLLDDFFQSGNYVVNAYGFKECVVFKIGKKKGEKDCKDCLIVHRIFEMGRSVGFFVSQILLYTDMVHNRNINIFAKA